MSSAIVVLTLAFVVLILLNVPVAFSMGIAALLGLLALPYVFFPLQTLVLQMATSIDKFALLAIPFFILSGLLMGHGGIARRLIDFANVLVGRMVGGLAMVNIMTCMFFGAISGSAAAGVSSVGGFMIPMMNRMGYHRDFNAAVTITAATTGLLIPPSNVMIVYSLATGGACSIAALFIAGIVPGVLMGLALMVVAWVVSRKNHYGKGETFTFVEGFRRFVGAILPLGLIIIVLGGILVGWFTATEASAIAVVYSFVLSVLVYREVKWRDLPKLILQSAITTAVVMMLIATSMALSWVLTYENVPQSISAFLMGLTDTGWVVLLIINILLLIVGCFMDMTPAVLIFTPIFLPVIAKYGMGVLPFGIVMITNLCIGLCTPPVGTCLYLGCGIAQTTVGKVIRHILPFYAAMIAVLMLLTYVPGLSTWLPEQLGLVGGK
jgi:tripartite ATP-independent transporter DctM subunit